MRRWWKRPQARPDTVVETTAVAVSSQDLIDGSIRELREGLVSLGERLAVSMDQLMSELSAIRDDLEKTTEPLMDVFPDIDVPQSPDEEYATYLHYFVLDDNVSKANGEALDVRVIGQLQDNTYAWVNEARRVCGVVTRDSFGDDIPMPDDTFRARIVSYPWGHVVENVFPRSLRSPFETRKSQTPTADWGRKAAEAVLSAQPEWVRGLRPGDVLVARIPYDGPMPVDRLGRKGKERPSVFMRWEGEYAILRACYDVKSFVGERNLGHRSQDTGCFSKPSVIRNAEYDTKIENLRRKLGRLGKQDLMALHIVEVEAPVSTPKAIDPSRTAPITTLATAPNPLVGHAESLNKEVFAQILKNVEVVAARRADSSVPRALAVALLEVLVEREDSRQLLLRDGLKFAVVGETLQKVAELRGTQIPKGQFGKTMREVVGDFRSTDQWKPFIEQDEHNLEVLKCAEIDDSSPRRAPNNAPEPLNRSLRWEEPVNVRFILNDDYLEPDLIVMDQSSSAAILGDRRVDFRAELNSLRHGGTAKAFIVGSNSEPARAKLVEAAQHRGWNFESSDATTRLKVVERLVRESGAKTITVVTRDTEIIAELENNGAHVNVVCEVEDPDDD